MNARNESGPVAGLRAVDVGAESQDAAPEPSQRQRTKAAAEREERKLDAAVRRVAERARARRPGHDPSIRITHVDPALLVPSSGEDRACANCGLAFLAGEGRRRDDTDGSPVHANGGCERARRRAAIRETAGSQDPAGAPMNGSFAPSPAADAEEQPAGAWCEQAIVDWLRAKGPKTAREIASRFAINQPQDAIARLRGRGLIEKTGVKRLTAGIKSGRPGAEYRATDTKPAGTGAPPAVQVAPTPRPEREIEAGSAHTGDSEAAPRHNPPKPEHAGEPADHPAPGEALTVREQLAVRYITALINSIDRASILHGDAPPPHVYDRIERLLEIQDGAT